MSALVADQLNQGCHCVSVERASLLASIETSAHEPGPAERWLSERPHLTASAPVFIASEDLEAMLAIVDAAESATRLAGFRDAVMRRAPAIAHVDHGPAGVMMGYDFHLTAAGPKLIEINTNAGGAFINAVLARTQRACCGAVDRLAAAPLAEQFDLAVIAMVENEWRRQRGAGRPRTIAIVDDAPAAQYLFPEFMLARKLLSAAGFEVVIADPSELRIEASALWVAERRIDLVYNRLVDFMLEAPEHVVLRDAYQGGAVVVTPNPHHHAMYADKRNLLLLSDAARLADWGLQGAQARLLSSATNAREVTDANAEKLWAERTSYFFKPWNGYGGKAVYRGDKLTKSAWAHVRNGGYIAQEAAAPSVRAVRVGDETRLCKLDVRLYAYEGRLLLPAARLYQGQTTNFRTPGGGFAPVIVI